MFHKLLLLMILVAGLSIANAAATDYSAIVPAGTDIVVTLEQPIDSGSAAPGATFAAVIANPVASVAGPLAIPARSPAMVELLVTPGAEPESKIFTVMLKEITVGGVAYPVSASWAMVPPPAPDAPPEAQLPTGATEVAIKGSAEAKVRVLQGPVLQVPSGTNMHFTLGALLTLRGK